MVGAEPADTVAPLDTELAQPVREAAHPARELAVGAAPLAVDQRGPIGGDPRSSLDPRPDSPVRHRRQDSHLPVPAAKDTTVEAMGRSGR